MTVIFSLYPFPSSSSSSSSFYTPLRTPNHHLSSFRRTKTTFHFKTTLITKSLLLTDTDPPLSPAVHTFWNWLSQEGVVSNTTPVRPRVVPEGLGLVAHRDIDKNEVVLEVPKRLWINPDTILASDIGNVCGGLKPWVCVALFFMIEKMRKEDSKWRCYMDVLPQYTNSTIYWSEEELSEIQGTQLLSTTLDVKEYVQSEFLKLKEEVILPNRQLFSFPITLDDFFWAFGIIRSRAFSRLRDQNLVLIPLVDLMNHSSSITTEDHAHEVVGAAGLFSWDLLFSLRSPTSVKAGEQVFIQYNLKKTNAEFALDYGFIESTSDRDAYTIALEICESDPYFRYKLDIAESNGLGQTACFTVILNRPLPPTMLPYLRLIFLGKTDSFLLELPFRNSVWGHLEFPVSRTNEQLLCQRVQHMCKSALTGYHTTLEEDEKLKEEGNLDPRLEIAVGIRAGEKKVLQQSEAIFKEMELKLDELEYYHDRRLKELGLVGEQGEIVCCQPK